MKFLDMRKVWDGRYLKQYELRYENKAGREKRYEMVSRRELRDPSDLGRQTSGVSIVAVRDGRLLLLREFRMSVNQTVYNLCAGMLEPGETLQDCIRRELYEETGLSVRRILDILPPSYAAVGISDSKTCIAFVEAEGEIADHTSQNEEIAAAFYAPGEVEKLLQSGEFSSRCQVIAYFFARGALPL